MAKKIPVTVAVWKAGHTSGTKFYQVVRFISATGHSFAIRHYGKVEMFTGLGKIAAGAVEMDETLQDDERAGLEKVNEKRRGGYGVDQQTDKVEHATTADALSWIRSNFGKKAQDLARPMLNSTDWKAASVASDPSAPSTPARAISDLDKHAQWGSW